MRLIDADALKEEFNKKKVVGRFNTLLLIDNAPTVAVNCKDCDGYEAGYSAGLNDAERPQGEWGQCYENYKNGLFYRDCSICGKATMTGDWKFCPYCGAEMKGE